MKKLLLLRHAKSSWADDQLDDHERPLNARGERDSFTMARYIADADEGLDVIFTSTATRALEFAHVISEFTDVTLVPELSFYTFDEDELMEIIRSLPNDANRVAVVAHNSAIHQVANRLSENELDTFPTAAVASFACHVEQWREINESNCELIYFQTAKQINSALRGQ
ncbi:MAG: phosphohistidine phosphatase [Arenicella sp.]|jgi:phosphohistidine phosphatase